jgi:Fur family zinc uptake transcriptional regulator
MGTDHHSHNHRHCVNDALQRAKKLCGSGLTRLREQVLQELWHSHQARGAYDLLNALNKTAKKKLAPLSVYRALDYLVEHGLAHRIESINAYVGCPHPEQQHALQFLVCRDCQHVTELDDPRVSKALAASSRANRFIPARTVVEVLGQCASCASR